MIVCLIVPLAWELKELYFMLGDAAVGVGVKRHILSSAISKLKYGYKLNLGLWVSGT